MNGRLADIVMSVLAPEAAAGAYNDWRLVATTTLAPAILIALGVALLVALAISVHSSARLPRNRRILLGVLRALAALWVMALLLKPAVELRAVSRVRTRVALLADASRSMGLATPDGTRAEVASKHLRDSEARLIELANRAVIEPATFGERVHPAERLPDPLPANEAKTDLLRALGDVSFQSSGRELGAVILYSDGADTEGMTVESAKALGEKVGVPIYAIGFSNESAAPDLAIRRVLADEFAFVHNTVTLDVELEMRGLDVNSVPVTLRQDGTVVANKDAVFDQGRARVSFEFKPGKIGKLVYEVSVPVQSGEVVESNNARSVVLKVIRDRIRVLQVAGRPSWDERYLREFLKRNPNVDLISFFILRSTTDLQKAPQEELALIPFPVDTLFTEELPTFDVVIYQNFNYRPYRMQTHLKHVRDFVLRGGGFLMIGGDGSFEDAFYAGTEVGDVLPVRLDGAQPWDNSEYRPRLTKEGRRHPITRLGEPGEPPESVFQQLPQLQGFNHSVELMPGAQALLSHPSLPGNPPVVAVREVGQGRSMSIATDSLWFWRFMAVGDGRAGREYDRFFTNSLRWLIRDPELARVRVKAERSVVLLGDPISAEVKVLGPDYRGLAGAEVTAELFSVEGGRRGQVALKQAVTGAEGTSMVVFEQPAAGTYVLRAQATMNGERIGIGEEPVIVEAADIEYQAPFPRPDIMRALAEGSGGRYLDLSESMPEIEIKDARRVEVDRTKRIAVWDTFPAFIGLLLLVAAEWWMRRRSGLL